MFEHVRALFLHLFGEEDRRLDFTLSHTGRTGLHYIHFHCRTYPLPGDLHQSELTEGQYIMASPVAFHQAAYIVVQLLLVLLAIHVDKVDNDNTTYIPQAELVHQFICGKHVELEGVFLLVLIEFLAAGIDINGEQCFGPINDEISTMFETDRPAEPRLHLAGNVKMVKNRLCALIEFNDFSALRSNQFQIMAHVVIDILVINLNRSEVRIEHIPDNSEGASHLFANQADGLASLQCRDGLLPPFHQQSEFVVQLGHAFVFSNSANDNTETLRFDRQHQLF